MSCIFILVLSEVCVHRRLFYVAPWCRAFRMCFPDLAIFPDTSIFSGVTFVFAFHTSCISNVRYYCYYYYYYYYYYYHHYYIYT